MTFVVTACILAPFRRRLRNTHAVRERVVSSYTVSDIVRQFLSVLGTALVSMGYSCRHYICVWDHHVGHELEKPFRRAVSILQGQKPEWDSHRFVDDGADCYDHSDLSCDPLVRQGKDNLRRLTEEIRIRDKDGRSDVQKSRHL